ncbi:MAG TPA: hypothetical protein VGZ26_12715 [Pirellulales bacterium]|jgi:hypothetical protein|nr:hypothetical protein [Pirellulales bacterium]
MNLEGTRRVFETTSHETANQYLRFGWNLINQYVTEAAQDRPASVTYVLASVRRLEDTRELLALSDPEEVNDYLNLGWKLIDKHVTSSEKARRRQETIHFVLAWQSDEPPMRPGSLPPATGELRTSFSPGDEL